MMHQIGKKHGENALLSGHTLGSENPPEIISEFYQSNLIDDVNHTMNVMNEEYPSIVADNRIPLNIMNHMATQDNMISTTKSQINRSHIRVHSTKG